MPFREMFFPKGHCLCLGLPMFRLMDSKTTGFSDNRKIDYEKFRLQTFKH